MAPRKSKSSRKRLNRTYKKRPIQKKEISNEQKSKFIKTFFEILHAIKLYHWKTKSYVHHEATDDLHEKLSNQVDRFVEVLIGKTSHRIQMVEEKMNLYDFKRKTEFRNKIFEFRQFLVDLDQIFYKRQDSDLLTIRDDMLESVNQFLYLYTLDN